MYHLPVSNPVSRILLLLAYGAIIIQARRRLKCTARVLQGQYSIRLSAFDSCQHISNYPLIFHPHSTWRSINDHENAFPPGG